MPWLFLSHSDAVILLIQSSSLVTLVNCSVRSLRSCRHLSRFLDSASQHSSSFSDVTAPGFGLCSALRSGAGASFGGTAGLTGGEKKIHWTAARFFSTASLFSFGVRKRNCGR